MPFTNSRLNNLHNLNSQHSKKLKKTKLFYKISICKKLTKEKKKKKKKKKKNGATDQKILQGMLKIA